MGVIAMLLERIESARTVIANCQSAKMDNLLRQRINGSIAILADARKHALEVKQSRSALKVFGAEILHPPEIPRSYVSKVCKSLSDIAEVISERASEPTELHDLLTSKAMSNPVEKAKGLILAVENQTYVIADNFVKSICPADINLAIPSVTGESRTIFQLERSQNLLTKPITRLPVSAIDPIDKHITKEINIRVEAATEWKKLFPIIVKKSESLDPEVRRFLDAVRSLDGAPLSLLTKVVLDYINANEGARDFRIRIND